MPKENLPIEPTSRMPEEDRYRYLFGKILQVGVNLGSNRINLNLDRPQLSDALLYALRAGMHLGVQEALLNTQEDATKKTLVTLAQLIESLLTPPAGENPKNS